ncbi:hypothetical protein HHL26_06700 [Sphingobium sp. TB-6]|uniref:hypothetical protein n=1 Tax=Sphingobium sp. TB-6 TaxID=2728850 RepID=UPI00146BFCCB|nr:hypothetical protein [Sphingobium sp. TB-6]NML88755.1 hypothetical protein [Sphingobium sp. TB-6]
MKFLFAVDYDDGKVKAKAGAVVPATIPSHRFKALRRSKLIVPAPDPLDHDGNGVAGGSKSGAESTAAQGAARRRKTR